MSGDKTATREVVTRLLEEYRPTANGHELDPERVRALVRESPEAVADAVPVMIRAALQSGSGIWGLLSETARIYEDVHGDDSLAVAVATAMREAGIAPIGRRVAERQGEIALGGDDIRGVVALQIALKDVETGSALRMEKLLAFRPERRQQLGLMIGRTVLEFPLDHDDRDLYEIPEVRRFMADLHRRLPYFPMYLTPDPGFAMFLVYFGTLSDPDAITQAEGGIQVDIGHPSVVARVRESLEAVRILSTKHGIDGSCIEANILRPYPPEVRGALFGPVSV